ncbi:PIN domain-containing protein [candidate division KSB1 bacterium]|nr:PIN domain-containing protein [candidate division KSB1 bacterium]
MIDKLKSLGRILLDTNILVYADNINSPFHATAKEIRDGCLRGEIQGCLSPQNLYEYFAVVTDSKKVEFPLSPEETINEIEKYLRVKAIKIIFPKPTTIQRVINLVKKYKIKKQEIFDIQLVATMLDNGVKNIVTLNEKHFKTISEIATINPFNKPTDEKTKEDVN